MFNFFRERHDGSMNLEMALIVSLLILASVAALGFMATGIDQRYGDGGNRVADGGGTPAVDPATVPTAVTGLVVVPTTTDEVKLSGYTATDDVAVTGYQIERNGIVVDTTTAAQYYDMGLSAATPYNYRIRAFDGDGNYGPWTSAPDTVYTYIGPVSFTDGFTRADSGVSGTAITGGGHTYTQVGDLQIKNNHLYVGTNPNSVRAWCTDFSVADGQAILTNGPALANLRIYGRMLDDTHGYQVRFNIDGSMSFHVANGAGAPPVISGGSFPAGTWSGQIGQALSLAIEGNKLTAYENGVELATVTDGANTYPAAGYWGFGAGSANMEIATKFTLRHK